MQKLTAELEKLTTRRDALNGKQTAAQSALDRALDARQKFMLEGDLEDDAISIKHQAAVDSATSALAGFALASSALFAATAEAEGKFAAKKQEQDRKVGAEKLAADTNEFETLSGPWLELTRQFAAAAAKVGTVHFEAGQIAGYLTNAASEVEMATEISLGNLRAFTTLIADGNMPIPAEPAKPVPVVAEPPPLPTKTVFVWHAITWTDHFGQQRVMGKWNNADLPIELAEFALHAGLATVPDDPRCKSKRGLGGGHPDRHWLNDLNTRIGPDIPGSQQSARLDAKTAPQPFIKVREPNKPYVIEHREKGI